MDLEDALKQAVDNTEVPIDTAKQIDIEVLQDNTKKERVEDETGNIYYIVSVFPGTNLSEKVVGLDEKFETDLANDLKLLAEIKERIDTKEGIIKKFIEKNGLGSFKTNILNVKYKSATTTTTIDTKRFKSELPELAAKYSTVGSRSSSLSVEVLDTPILAKGLLEL